MKNVRSNTEVPDMKHWFTTKHLLAEGTITACRNLPIAANDSFTDLPDEVSCPRCVRHIPAHLAAKERKSQRRPGIDLLSGAR